MPKVTSITHHSLSHTMVVSSQIWDSKAQTWWSVPNSQLGTWWPWTLFVNSAWGWEYLRGKMGPENPFLTGFQFSRRKWGQWKQSLIRRWQRPSKLEARHGHFMKCSLTSQKMEGKWQRGMPVLICYFSASTASLAVKQKQRELQNVRSFS